MKTRYSALVSVKKNSMQKSEQELQKANRNLNNAKEALASSLASLHNITPPPSGKMADFLSSRSLLDAQREIIAHNREWVLFCEKERELAKEQLQADMIEYEKFKYLDLQEIKKQVKKQKIQEAKELDEVALMSYDNQHTTGKLS